MYACWPHGPDFFINPAPPSPQPSAPIFYQDDSRLRSIEKKLDELEELLHLVAANLRKVANLSEDQEVQE
jgi:hypothetical protein